MKSEKITLIIPIYDDWNTLKKCLKSIIEHVDISTHKIILINDNGPNANKIEKRIKRKIRNKNFLYYRNTTNLGFVKTCNRAVFEIDKSDNNIMVLNSDTIVTEGFLEEMTKVLNSREDIGAVCPRSNNATIFSVPINSNGAMSMRKSYRLYKKIREQLPSMYVSPVAHGFCLLTKRSVIKKYGFFDEVYGKGYGEENDFCMRIRKKYKCAVANRAYVFHFKARSFTEEKRNKLVEQNEKILIHRYPNYYNLVNQFLNSTAEEEKKLY